MKSVTGASEAYRRAMAVVVIVGRDVGGASGKMVQNALSTYPTQSFVLIRHSIKR